MSVAAFMRSLFITFIFCICSSFVGSKSFNLKGHWTISSSESGNSQHTSTEHTKEDLSFSLEPCNITDLSHTFGKLDNKFKVLKLFSSSLKTIHKYGYNDSKTQEILIPYIAVIKDDSHNRYWLCFIKEDKKKDGKTEYYLAESLEILEASEKGLILETDDESDSEDHSSAAELGGEEYARNTLLMARAPS